MKKIRYWYSSLPLSSKITLLMALLITLLAGSFSLFSISFFNQAYSHETEQIARQRLELFAENLDRDLLAINNQIIETSTMPLFVRTIQRALEVPSKDLETLVNFQQFFKRIADSSPLIHSVHVITKDDILYSPYEQTSRTLGNDLSYPSLSHLQKVTLLPGGQNPFAPSRKSVPIVVALNLLGTSSYLELTNNLAADVFLIILLDEQVLLEKINSPGSAFFSYTNTLLFQGVPLLPEAPESDSAMIRFATPTQINGLELMMSIAKKSYKPLVAFMIIITIITALLVTGGGSVLISRISRHITSPFSAMTKMVKEMETGSYEFDIKPRYADETGTLIEGMNSMYHTIIQQMRQIKEEEQQKYRYLSQMLTEQINPHFIYNTLEIINMEVINGRQENASDMIATFAAFLRHTLNQGEDTTTLAQELEHCRKYLSIMNTRLGLQILIFDDIAPHLELFEIPKSILLPLVENAIRHGFETSSMQAQTVEHPSITITAKQKEDRYSIGVIDNGTKGIDIEQAYKALNEKSAQSGHIGLNNVLNRLKLYFDDVEAHVSSIPGYRNAITFTFSIDPDRGAPSGIAALAE